MLRAIGADNELKERYAGLGWQYSPGDYLSGQDTSDWPRKSQVIRRESLKTAMRLLRGAADEYRLKHPSVLVPQVSSGAPRGKGNEVFIIYRHDHALRSQVEGFVAAVTASTLIIFDKEPSCGSETVFEKLKRRGERAGFAIALMTPDDNAGTLEEGNQEKRARQNVLLEFGLVRRDGSDATESASWWTAGTSIPSDLADVLYTTTDANWHMELAKDMKAAGLTIDLNSLR